MEPSWKGVSVVRRPEPGDVIEIEVDGTTLTAEVMAATAAFAILHSVEQGTAACVPWRELEGCRIFDDPELA
jgi:hypothetical protein